MIPASGLFCEYRGRAYREAFWGDTWIALLRDNDGGPDEFPDAIQFGENSYGHWVKVPRSSPTRRWQETVHARWEGVEVTVQRVLPDVVVLGYDGDPQVAADHGMEGDQYNLWTALAPPEAVEVTRVDISELP